jgi:hypothetical protein
MREQSNIKFAEVFLTKAKSAGFTAQETYRILKSANWFEDNVEKPLQNINARLTPSIDSSKPPLPMNARSGGGAPIPHHIDTPRVSAPPKTPTPTAPSATPAAIPHPTNPGTAAIPPLPQAAPSAGKFLPRIYGPVGWAGAAAGGIGALDMMGNTPAGMSPGTAATIGGVQVGLGGIAAYQATRPGAWSRTALREAGKFARPGAAALTHAGLLGTAGLAIGGLSGDFGAAKQHWNAGNYLQSAGSALNQFARPLYEPVVSDFQQGHPIRGAMRAGELLAPFAGPVGVATSMGLGAINASLDFRDHYNQAHKD